MKCKAVLAQEDGVWFSTVSTATGEPVGCTPESGSFDALVERVKVAVLENLELNLGLSRFVWSCRGESRLARLYKGLHGPGKPDPYETT